MFYNMLWVNVKRVCQNFDTPSFLAMYIHLHIEITAAVEVAVAISSRGVMLLETVVFLTF